MGNGDRRGSQALITFRLCARLDIKSPHLVKTVNLEGLRKLGDPADYARRYDRAGIDELIYLDIVASLYGRNSLHDLVERTTRDVLTPITVGGGVRSVEDALGLLRAGADKIAVNTAALRRPALITELANKFGSQAVVLQIDAKRKATGWEAWCEGGREPTGKDVCAWVREGTDLGCGEILLTSIDCEGVRRGVDRELARRVAAQTERPVLIAGGVGGIDHVLDAAASGVAGVAIAGALHYAGIDLVSARTALAEAGIPVRPVATAA